MKKFVFLSGFLLGVIACLWLQRAQAKPLCVKTTPPALSRVPLPQPSFSGGMALKKALLKRRTRYEFSPETPSLEEISQLLWAAQGITSPSGLRTAPSAGALYGLHLYVLTGGAPSLSCGVYLFDTQVHDLIKVFGEDRREAVASSFFQTWAANGALMIVVCGFEGQISQKYGNRGKRYLLLETGHAVQNLLLQATGLGLNTGLIGAFREEELASCLSLREGEEPLYVVSIGYPPKVVPGQEEHENQSH